MSSLDHSLASPPSIQRKQEFRDTGDAYGARHTRGIVILTEVRIHEHRYLQGLLRRCSWILNQVQDDDPSGFRSDDPCEYDSLEPEAVGP